MACGEREDESLLENEEWVLEFMATPLSGLGLLLTFVPTGLARGEATPAPDGGGLRGLATDVVEGDEMEDGTGEVWG